MMRLVADPSLAKRMQQEVLQTQAEACKVADCGLAKDDHSDLTPNY